MNTYAIFKNNKQVDTLTLDNSSLIEISYALLQWLEHHGYYGPYDSIKEPDLQLDTPPQNFSFAEVKLKNQPITFSIRLNTITTNQPSHQ